MPCAGAFRSSSRLRENTLAVVRLRCSSRCVNELSLEARLTNIGVHHASSDRIRRQHSHSGSRCTCDDELKQMCDAGRAVQVSGRFTVPNPCRLFVDWDLTLFCWRAGPAEADGGNSAASGHLQSSISWTCHFPALANSRAECHTIGNHGQLRSDCFDLAIDPLGRISVVMISQRQFDWSST